MKNMIIAIAAVVLAAAASAIAYACIKKKPAQTLAADEEGHALTALWKQFHDAQSKDLPKKELSILGEIKTEAKKINSPVDFYDAATMAGPVQWSVNWKLRDSVEIAIRKEIMDFGCPGMAVFYHRNYGSTRSYVMGREELKKFILDNASALKASCNRVFHKRDTHVSASPLSAVAPVLVESYANDYEYALWSIALGSKDAVSDWAYGELKAYLGEEYPKAAMLEYCTAVNGLSNKERAEYGEKFAKKYEGKAIALLGREDVLNNRFSQLGYAASEKQATSDDYKALRAECAAFEKDRKAFIGSEGKLADCFKSISKLIEVLDSESLDVSINMAKVTVLVRNIKNISFELLMDDKSVYKKAAQNTVGSYYLTDTLSFELPATLDDGTYKFVCKGDKEKTDGDYQRYSLSCAMSGDTPEKYRIYVADFVSGEPAAKVDLVLKDDSGKEIERQKDFAINGFTQLPEAFTSHKGSSELWCSYTDASGRKRSANFVSMYIGRSFYNEAEEDSVDDEGRIFTDCSAFNPGDTVRFKVLAFSGNRFKGYNTFEKGRELRVILTDAKGDKVGEKTLVTNEYGSASGEFVLDPTRKMGVWGLELESEKTYLCHNQIRVDEFVLPTYDLTFHATDRLYFPGDRITVSGSVKSYTGHTLAGAALRWRVPKVKDGEFSGECTIADDGSFSISFPTEGDASKDWNSYYTVNARVTDATGETKEFNKTVQVFTSLALMNELKGEDGSFNYESKERLYGSVIVSEKLPARLWTESHDGVNIPLDIDYEVLDSSDRKVLEGRAKGGENFELDFSTLPSGLYTFKASTATRSDSGETYKAETKYSILKVSDNDRCLNTAVDDFHKKVSADGIIGLQLGEGRKALWAIVELYGIDGEVLMKDFVTLDGKIGTPGSLKLLKYEFKKEYPNEVILRVFYFRDGGSKNFSFTYSRPDERLAMPLEFTRVEDKVLPGSECTVGFKTDPAAECVVSVFDMTTESIMWNRWNKVYLSSIVPSVTRLRTVCGFDRSSVYPMYDYMAGAAVKSVARAANGMAMAESCAVTEDCAVEEAIPFQLIEEKPGFSFTDPASVEVREDFRTSLCFEPHVRPDKKGDAEVSFRTSDKLSTYVVSVFAHDKSMKNASERSSMVVTMPVKVSLVQPQFLYVGDKYVLHANVSSTSESKIDGKMVCEFFDGKLWKGVTPVKSMTRTLSVRPGSSAESAFEFTAPEGIRTLGVKLTFLASTAAGADLSDAVFVTIPVYEASQTITEAHSAILLDGMDRDALVAALRSQFVNTSSYGAEYSEISIIDMVKEALPSMKDPDSDNVLTLVEALYANALIARLSPEEAASAEAVKAELVKKILGCRNSDGGFGWFAEFSSSPFMTTVLLKRIAGMRIRGLAIPEELSASIDGAVKYLDDNYFKDSKRPYWCGGISIENYLYVRSLFPDVEFKVSTTKEFRKEAKEYLVPSGARGLSGMILAKARRLSTLMNLSYTEEGVALAKKLGIKIAARSKLEKSVKADIESLLEYAVKHPHGGTYYPNAVMPFRGLLESEIHAHTLLCELFARVAGEYPEEFARAAGLADEIRIWMMLQKETQQWGDNPEFIEAIAAVLDGSDAAKNTRVIVMKQSFRKPFEEIKAAGNGFTLGCEYYLDGHLLKDGDSLKVGDRVTAKYNIWNEENRSFVRLEVARPACFRPVAQLSGRYGWWLNPLRVAGWFAFSPQGYRTVRHDATEYWFDSYPEEKTSISEDFYVTQEGVFRCPVAVIESLYAPHYRANGDYEGAFTAKR